MADIMPSSARSSLTLVCPLFTAAFARQPVRLSALERLIAYSGGFLPTSTSRDLDAWQSELLQALGLDDVVRYPSAPLTWLGASNDPAPGTWLHAEPVVQAISTQGLTMNLCAPWTAACLDEVELLVRDHLASLQMNWRVASGRSFLQIRAALDVQTATARNAMQCELQEALPTGPDATAIRRAMNELQMLLHEKLNYPSAPNAIWLWGAGQIPQLQSRELPSMWTNDDYTRGIYCAHAARDRCSALTTIDAILDSARNTGLLAVIGDHNPEDLERLWFAPALRALDQGRLQTVDIYLDGWQLHASRSLVRRVFARSRPLTTWLKQSG